mmetsp:Transcript_58387/g.125466  ORF Transcript_58387/g.125466 Transcript_58387/m.125466 type:complete len:264 (-) Transcript_58387:37-828(-)
MCTLMGFATLWFGAVFLLPQLARAASIPNGCVQEAGSLAPSLGPSVSPSASAALRAVELPLREEDEEEDAETLPLAVTLLQRSTRSLVPKAVASSVTLVQRAEGVPSVSSEDSKTLGAGPSSGRERLSPRFLLLGTRLRRRFRRQAVFLALLLGPMLAMVALLSALLAVTRCKAPPTPAAEPPEGHIDEAVAAIPPPGLGAGPHSREDDHLPPRSFVQRVVEQHRRAAACTSEEGDLVLVGRLVEQRMAATASDGAGAIVSGG